MKQGILLALMLSLTASLWADNKRINLLEAVGAQMVHYSVSRTKASFNGKGLAISITNTSREALVIKIDPARLFTPEDTNYQDLMLPGNELLFVGLGRTRTIEVQTYCARSAAGWIGTKQLPKH